MLEKAKQLLLNETFGKWLDISLIMLAMYCAWFERDYAQASFLLSLVVLTKVW